MHDVKTSSNWSENELKNKQIQWTLAKEITDIGKSKRHQHIEQSQSADWTFDQVINVIDWYDHHDAL